MLQPDKIVRMFRTIAPFNEPSSIYWWAGNNQEGCRFDITTQNIIIEKLQSMLEQKGLAQVSCAHKWLLCPSAYQLPLLIRVAGASCMLATFPAWKFHMM